MNDLDIPILRTLYELSKLLHAYRSGVPKSDRHGLWNRCEMCALDVLSDVLRASQLPKKETRTPLLNASVNLNLLRLLLRLAWESRCIDSKKVALLQQHVDEAGRMLGGWIKSMGKPPPQKKNKEKEEVPGSAKPDVVVGIVVPVVVDVETTVIKVQFRVVAIGRPLSTCSHPCHCGLKHSLPAVFHSGVAWWASPQETGTDFLLFAFQPTHAQCPLRFADSG